MFNNSRTERFYCKDKSGRDLFFIELVIDDEISFVYMNTSLTYDINTNQNIEELTKQVTEIHIDKSRRNTLMESIFSVIQSLPGIENYYFSPEFLNKNGHHVPEYSAVINNLLQDKDFPDYTVFSCNINSFYFDYSLPFLQEKLTKEKVKQIDKKYFEQLVKNDITLSHEYVEWLSTKSKFFHVFLFDQKTQYDCFIMKQEEEVKLFFVRQVISI